MRAGTAAAGLLRASVQIALALRVMAAVFCSSLKFCAALLGPAPPRACMVGHGCFARRQGPRSRLRQRCIGQISIAVVAALRRDACRCIAGRWSGGDCLQLCWEVVSQGGSDGVLGWACGRVSERGCRAGCYQTGQWLAACQKAQAKPLQGLAAHRRKRARLLSAQYSSTF